MSAAPLQLDFGAEPVDRWRWGAWAVLAGALALGVLADTAQDRADGTLESLRLQQERIEAKTQPARGRAATVAPDAPTLRQLKRLNAVIDQLALPWGDLFTAVEKADARQLGVLSFAPNVQDQSLRLAGEARSMDEVLAYVDRLSQQPQLSQVHLLGYDTVNRDGDNVISFTLSAKWRPA